MIPPAMTEAMKKMSRRIHEEYDVVVVVGVAYLSSTAEAEVVDGRRDVSSSACAAAAVLF